MKSLALITALLLLPHALYAQVYRCVVDDEVIYTQHPCAEDAEVIEIRPHQPDTHETWRLEEETTRLRALSEEMERQRRIREIDRQIEGLMRANNELAQQAEQELSDLRAQQRRAEITMAPRQTQQDIAARMEAVNRRVEGQVRSNQQRIERLRAEQASLRQQ